MTKKIILLNGPPRCGKDSIANFMNRDYVSFNGFVQRPGKMKFADPIKQSLRALFSLTDEEFELFDNQYKDTPLERLSYKTWRQWCIAFSEDFAKKNGGIDIFGKILRNKIEKSNLNIFLISDSGFVEEAQCLKGLDVSLVRISRPGHNFDNDSRSYWSNDSTKFPEYHLDNDGTEAEYHVRGAELISQIMFDSNVEVEDMDFRITKPLFDGRY